MRIMQRNHFLDSSSQNIRDWGAHVRIRFSRGNVRISQPEVLTEPQISPKANPFSSLVRRRELGVTCDTLCQAVALPAFRLAAALPGAWVLASLRGTDFGWSAGQAPAGPKVALDKEPSTSHRPERRRHQALDTYVLLQLAPHPTQAHQTDVA